MVEAREDSPAGLDAKQHQLMADLEVVFREGVEPLLVAVRSGDCVRITDTLEAFALQAMDAGAAAFWMLLRFDDGAEKFREALRIFIDCRLMPAVREAGQSPIEFDRRLYARTRGVIIAIGAREETWNARARREWARRADATALVKTEGVELGSEATVATIGEAPAGRGSSLSAESCSATATKATVSMIGEPLKVEQLLDRGDRRGAYEEWKRVQDERDSGRKIGDLIKKSKRDGREKVYRAEFDKWLAGALREESVMTKRIRDFLLSE